MVWFDPTPRMTSPRHLKELLNEDQEPFLLSSSIKHLHLNNKQNSSFRSHFCKNACFFSTRNSPILSPIAAAVWGNKTPKFLHVPPKTAALLLEAACRIQNNSSVKHNLKTSVFESIIRRLTTRNRSPKLKSDVIRWADSVKSGEDQLSSVWSEELSSSSSSSTSCSGNLVEFLIPNNSTKTDEEEFSFCLSHSPGRRSPTPCRNYHQKLVNYEDDPCVKFQVEEEEEEKEQCSPVCILDPPFEDDDCEEEEGDCNGDKEDFDMECSYACVQRAKHHLLQKLRNFERLAELDPIELEKRMLEEEDEDDYGEDVDSDDGNHSSSLDVEGGMEGYLVDIARKSGLFEELLRPGMNTLLPDLISELEKPESLSEGSYESIVKRVSKRLASWKDVEPNTIDMMVAIDLKRENDTWKKAREETPQTAKMLELPIFAALVEELLDELLMS